MNSHWTVEMRSIRNQPGGGGVVGQKEGGRGRRARIEKGRRIGSGGGGEGGGEVSEMGSQATNVLKQGEGEGRQGEARGGLKRGGMIIGVGGEGALEIALGDAYRVVDGCSVLYVRGAEVE